MRTGETVGAGLRSSLPPGEGWEGGCSAWVLSTVYGLLEVRHAPVIWIRLGGIRPGRRLRLADDAGAHVGDRGLRILALLHLHERAAGGAHHLLLDVLGEDPKVLAALAEDVLGARRRLAAARRAAQRLGRDDRRFVGPGRAAFFVLAADLGLESLRILVAFDGHEG